MVSLIQRYTPLEFDEFIHLPENAERRFELVGGEVIEVPSNMRASRIAGLFLTALNIFLRVHKLGIATGADGGYIVMGERYVPDVAFISYARHPEMDLPGYNPVAPDLAIEVISNPNNAEEHAVLRRKISNYLLAGTLVWVVNPLSQRVEVYAPAKPVLVVDRAGTLYGDDRLPGFALPLVEIFED